ncbi:tryptophan--tRNA ligase [Anaeramoeba flamelloides]|uniref:tryptophan--tRNA ligase n=1 Tax=Anaeramoeba flamelloides TaxID=1746091 RepID=A0ABQ8YDW8_9EUKA|nr:tryptophan--tRNA ligase [Anaeramoeba flamelloides]
MSQKEETKKEETKKEETKKEETKQEEKKEETKKQDLVTPYEIKAVSETGIDYDKLVDRFGASMINEEMIEKLTEIATKKGIKLHHWIRRGLYFCHHDLHRIIIDYEQGKPFFLYTGRGPSGQMHLGHLVSFILTKHFQDIFGCAVVVQMTDDEKYLWNRKFTQLQIHKFLMDNIKDIISVGFDPEKTFIFSDYQYIKEMYPNITKVQRAITFSQVKGTFGFTNSNNIGQVAFPAIQIVPCFSSTFPKIFENFPKSKSKKSRGFNCLIPCAIDQAPYFRQAREIAYRIKEKKPSLIYAKFFPALQGHKTKMSSSKQTTAIYLTDKPNQIKNKINKHAFSGGGRTKEEHEKFGADLTVDVPYAYLKVFLEDDELLEEIRVKYGNGTMGTVQVKRTLIETLQKIVKKHQETKAQVTDETVELFMTPRALKFD